MILCGLQRPKLIALPPWRAQESILPGIKLAIRILLKTEGPVCRVRHDSHV